MVINIQTDLDLDLVEELKFTAENLNQAYIEQPAKFAYWSAQVNKSKFMLEKKKLELEQLDSYLKKTLMGELDQEVRENMAMEGERVTEARVTARVYIHPRYLETVRRVNQLQKELVELQYQTDTLYTAKDAFIQRKDMIISLGANLRQEKTNIEP